MPRVRGPRGERRQGDAGQRAPRFARNALVTQSAGASCESGILTRGHPTPARRPSGTRGALEPLGLPRRRPPRLGYCGETICDVTPRLGYNPRPLRRPTRTGYRDTRGARIATRPPSPSVIPSDPSALARRAAAEARDLGRGSGGFPPKPRAEHGTDKSRGAVIRCAAHRHARRARRGATLENSPSPKATIRERERAAGSRARGESRQGDAGQRAPRFARYALVTQSAGASCESGILTRGHPTPPLAVLPADPPAPRASPHGR